MVEGLVTERPLTCLAELGAMHFNVGSCCVDAIKKTVGVCTCKELMSHRTLPEEHYMYPSYPR